MADEQGLEQEVERRLRAGESIRKVTADLRLSRSYVQRRADQLRKTNSVRFWIGLTVSVVVLLGSVWLLTPKVQSPVQSSIPEETRTEDPSWRKNIRTVSDQILATKVEDKWLIETEQIPLPTPEVVRLHSLGQRFTEQIEFGLERNSSIPEVANLRKIFGKHLFVTFFSNFGGGTSQMVTQDKQQVMSPNPDNQEVTIFGRFAENHQKIRGEILLYTQDWRSLMIAAIEWNPDWLDAVSLHELYHAKLHREGAASATAPPSSDAYIQEEIAAHDLEHEVLNLRTKGAYAATVEKILDSKNATTPEQLVERLTADDLRKLDALFESKGLRETGVRLSQFWMSLMNGLTSRQKHTEEDLLKEKIANYRLLVSIARQ